MRDANTHTVPAIVANAATARAIVESIASGHASAESITDAALAVCAQLEPQLGAWVHFNPEYARAQARLLDQQGLGKLDHLGDLDDLGNQGIQGIQGKQRDKLAGATHTALYGVPVGVKDIIDTTHLLTEYGTVLHRGHQPTQDAAIVTRLRAAGAVILGKTVTTELATYAPGKTRNPHNLAHTPGGSSSGSAAAVAAGMVPLAVGSQTNGSVIRPAAFCGVYGYKPTRGLISRQGVLQQSQTLDQMGFFANTLTDLAMLARVLIPAAVALPTPDALLTLSNTSNLRIAVLQTPLWDRASAEMQAAFNATVTRLGVHAHRHQWPDAAAGVWDWHRCVMETEMAHHLQDEWQRGRDQLSESLRGQISRGLQTPVAEYSHALAQIDVVNAAFDAIYAKHDVILTLSVPGAAPQGLTSTGDPVFCTPWSYCGMPAINVPYLLNSEGMPLGLQLLAPRGGDARLLRATQVFSQLLEH